MPIPDGRTTVGTAQWVVVLEAQPTGEVEISRLRRLLEHLPGTEPVALHSAERVAVQVQVAASSQVEALSMASADLRVGLSMVGLSDLRVIRAEVLTQEEFERDCQRADGEGFAASKMQECVHGRKLGGAGEQLLRQAFQDPLTQLPGRGYFMDQLERALLSRGSENDPPVVVVLNLAATGAVNERWGRSAGDEVLAASARRLTAALPPGIIAGRIAGDEFAVMLGMVSQAEAEAITSVFLDALAQPVPIVDIEVGASARAGIALGRPGQDAGDLLAQARAAARAARERSSALEHYRPELGAVEPLRLQAAVVHDPMGYLLLMQRAAMAANESSDLQHAAGLVVNQVCAHVGFQVGHLYVVAGDGLVPARLTPTTSKECQELVGLLDSLSLAPGEGLAGRVLESGEPAWVTDIASAGAFPWTVQAIACGFNAVLAFPVLVRREVVGVLEFFAEHARTPDDELVEVLRFLGSQLGRVVERQRALLRPAKDDRLPDA